MPSRRTFLGALAAVAAAPFLPEVTLPVAAPVTQGLMFHPDAFALTMGPVTRFDVLYGFGALQPSLACHIANDEPFRASEGYRAYLKQDAAIQASVI